MHLTLRKATPGSVQPFLLLSLGLFALLATSTFTAALEPISEPAVAQARLQSGAGGTLCLAFDGVLPLTETLLITTNTTVDASGHDVTLDGRQQVRHFTITNGATLRLINLSLINGRAVAAGSAARGGSIHNSGGTLELINCTLLNNEAVGANGVPPDSGLPGGEPAGMRGGSAYGGAIYSDRGQITMTNCLLVGNAASGGLGAASNDGYTGGGGDALGGAIYCTNALAIMFEVAFTNNLAKAGDMSSGRPLEGGGSAYGGAIAAEAGDFTIVSCRFVANEAAGATKVGSDISRETGAAKGGALYQGAGTMTVESSLLERNTTLGGLGAERGGRQIIFGDGKGGAVYSVGTVQMRNSAVISNSATGGDLPPDCCSPFIAQAGTGQGGGVVNEGFLNVVNSTLAENSAVGGRAGLPGSFSGPAYGGAISVVQGAASFLNVTLASNRVQAVSARRAFGSSIAVVGGTAVCTNTILSCLSGQTNVFGPIIDGGHNLASDESAMFTQPSSRSNVDPMLAPLAYNGGVTPTMALLPPSPALDYGNDLASPANDQRGFQRPVGAAADIGAFELTPKITLTRSTDGSIQLIYIFRAEQLQRISASTNLLDWVSLNVAASDTNGVVRFDDLTAAQLPLRFYRVENASGAE